MTDQDYQNINEATVGGGPSNIGTYAKAPPVTFNLYDEVSPTLYMSNLVYEITNIIKKTKRGNLTLDIPADFPIPNLDRFLEESIDLTDPNYNNGNGMSFYEIDTLVRHNEDVLIDSFGKNSFVRTVIRRVRDDLAACVADGDTTDPMKKVFLTHHRSIQRNVACVYSVVKDTINKRIIVSFRGSQGFFISTRDWQTNFNARVVGLQTPKKIKDKMEGILQTRVLVHRGLYEYLFCNEFIEGEQRYDKIIADIKNAMKGEKGYSIYVTGHSLGGGLATMFSLKLAGAGKKHDDIPRPITCITWAGLMSGTAGYRTAMEHLERDGLIRHLRINNGEDIVPAVPPCSLLRKRLMKHTGINLRLTSSSYRIEHSSRANLWTAILNSMFKPVFCFLTWHLLGTHETRMERIAEELKGLKLDDLYKDETIVSLDFIEGRIS